jgi:hypothetical protein
MRHVFALLKALLHERAALRTGEMGVIPAGRPHELAHLLKSRLGKPSLTAAALNGNAIGLQFVFAHRLVGAFMAEDPRE